jgi:FAD/FMN-containing dehydrogenase
MASFESWGRYPRAEQRLKPLFWAQDFPVRSEPGLSQLPAGMGRSYGDVCLNDGNRLLLTRGLDRLLAFDARAGTLCCESGVTLAEILDFALPHGWFLPVTPGTKFVTVGGAIANDVHGKNHHVAGTFGRHLLRFGLARSDGTCMECSPTENADWYSATIAGLGLTGLIEWAEIQLKQVVSRKIAYQAIQFYGLEEFIRLSEENSGSEYTVAWIDCVASRGSVLRGIFMCGDHSPTAAPRNPISRAKFTMPFDLPGFVLNRATVSLFNTLYFHKQLKKHVTAVIDYEPFFYPLDSVLHWNRGYGKAGLLQFQCVIPGAESLTAMREILAVINRSGLASFLAVLKVFGNPPSPGMMSFPMPGITLALDFPIKSDRSFSLLDRLGKMTLDAGGRIYPAKDARMTPEQFRSFYPNYSNFARFIDPRFSSSFWRRVRARDE